MSLAVNRAPDLDSAPLCDTAAVRRYLRFLAPTGGWSIVWKEGQGFPARSFPNADQLEEAVAFVGELVARRKDVYAQFNPAGDITKKASKEQITSLAFLHLDLDSEKNGRSPEEDAAFLRDEFDVRPHLIVLSGHGVHAYWRLAEPLGPDRREAVEAINRALEAALKQPPGAWNVDRILRVAGTSNFKKPAEAKPVREFWAWDTDKVGPAGYDLAPFELALTIPPAGAAAPAEGAAEAAAEADELLPEELPRFAALEDIPALCGEEYADLRELLSTGRNPRRPEPYPSRSEGLFAAVCRCVRAGCTTLQIAALLLDPKFGISASVLEKRRSPRRYAVRQIVRARQRVAAERQDYRRDAQGRPYANDQDNIRLALHRLGVRLSHNVFADRLLVNGRDDVERELTDAAVDRLWFLLDEKTRLRPHITYFQKVVLDTARAAAFHPVVDYLDNLHWDKKPRIDAWLIDYFKAKDTDYVRSIGRLMLVAAVRRVKQPGCKFDEMVVLEGAQGNKKSSALARLAVRPEWFTDELPLNAESREIVEQLAGRWIVEASELSGMRRGEVEHLKAMLSRQADRARPAYGRLPVEYPRQCIIIGTTNSGNYLKDSTGNRRFWPVTVGEVDLAALTPEVVDQLWAEAAVREAAGESIRLDHRLYEAAAEEQEARRITHPWEEVIQARLGDRNGKIRSIDVWGLIGLPVERRTQESNNDLGKVMRALGWERRKLRFAGPPEWCYARGNAKEREQKIVVTWSPTSNGSLVPDVHDEPPQNGSSSGDRATSSRQSALNLPKH